ncbi:methyltransferase domain-containing protein [Pseudoflavitalea sp. G-6-1-2]|uniref:class I SAM-dependent methyltransferase n=1 Tax=Pseudoflavitalea sp. G-6-1-2 TaxID=2728841 RepID=UPI00146E59FE|nr:class I SAM-dependent methyltransferase [Pseudoflavitalea sp. G-6-1-2]NML21230.1 methyltransferase domain-containing protein [Pseudoflavitalea sp. G-6-1-2]
MKLAKNTKSGSGDGCFSSETKFCSLVPDLSSELNEVHWAPLRIIRKSVEFLAHRENLKILDIGSGIGKFCLAAASYKSDAHFYGVEQRASLIERAEALKHDLGLPNITFLHKNFTQLDLGSFDGFFFYNAFFENIPGAYRIDESIEFSKELYDYYTHYLYNELSVLQPGVRIATYCSWDDEIPPTFKLQEWHEQGLLKFWIRQ